MFAIFDPKGLMGVSMLWVSLGAPVVGVPVGFWGGGSRLESVWKRTLGGLEKQLKDSLGELGHPGTGHWVVSIGLFLGFSNVLGLLPYTFTPASHLSVTLTLGLSFWMGYFLYSAIAAPTFNLSHLVPLGTPGVLQPFMVLVETVSTLIRPFTLSVRLAANMVAGHLLISLASSSVFLSGCAMLLVVLESLVALVQAYVFILLSVLYFSESNSPSIFFSGK